MKNKKSTLRKYLLSENDKDMSVNTVVRLKKILNECICDFQEQEDCQKIEILKNILLLLTKLVFDDQEISIVINQEVIAKVEINLNLQFPRVMKHGNDPNPISISNGGRQQSKINCINS